MKPLLFSALLSVVSFASTIPTGSSVVVRTDEAIESTEASDNKMYRAVVQNDVTDSAGNIAIPKGSPAELVIRDTSNGKVKSASLMLDVAAVTVNGQRMLLNTEDLAQKNNKGVGKNKRTAVMVGGGAALGGIIGAIAGGGKGAAIGAAAGAGAGTAAQVLTKGKEVKVPAETLLTFKLSGPMELAPR